MIEHRGKHYELSCDNCGHVEEFDDFDEAVEFKKNNGWKSIKLGVDWVDHCDDCV